MELLNADRIYANGFDIRAKLLKGFKAGFMEVKFVADVTDISGKKKYTARYYSIEQAKKNFEADFKQVVEHFCKIRVK